LSENAHLVASLNVTMADAEATDEIADAGVFGEVHFRTSCVRGNALGRAVAEYVSTRAMRSGDDSD
jgi:hypothetical protein